MENIYFPIKTSLYSKIAAYQILLRYNNIPHP